MRQKLSLLPSNKKGAGPVVWFLVVFLSVVVLAGISWVFITQTSVEKGQKELTEKTLADCNVAPTVTWTGLNKENPGTTVSVNGNARINDKFFGPVTSGTSGTTYHHGDMLDLLIGAPNFINTTVEDFGPLECGDNKLTVELYATSAMTLDILDQNYNAVTDNANGGATNISNSASNIPFIIRLNGVKDESSGKLLVTVETNTTNADDITISATAGAGANVIDGDFDEAVGYDLFAEEFTGGSLKKAFVVAEVIDGVQHDYTAIIIPESGKTLGAGTKTQPVYVNVYSAQAYVETDGSFKVGWENKDGTLKYEDKWTDHDFLIE